MKLHKKYLLMLLFISTISIAQSKLILQKAVETKTASEESYPVDPKPLLEQYYKFNNIDPYKTPANVLRKTTAWNFTKGTQKSFRVANLTPGNTYTTSFTCQAVGLNCYVFVEDSSWTLGRVDQNAVDSVQIAFDSRTPSGSINANKGIFQNDVDTFGDPPNVDADSKIIILILNIRDGYTGVTGSGGYVAGFFDPGNETGSTGNQPAEIYHLDCYPQNLKNSNSLTSGMSTTAHEFQHMIHYNYDKQEGTFINEAMSMVAEVVNGYPMRSQSTFNAETNHYLLNWRSADKTLVLTDYARAARYATYLYEQFGKDILKKTVQSSLRDEAGVNAAMAAVSPATTRRFADVLEDWFIANFLNDKLYNSRYGYTNSKAGNATAREHLNPNISNYSDAVYKYGAQYITYSSGSNLAINFNLSSSLIKVKAIKSGGGTTVIDNVTSGVNYTVPDFGSTYNKVTFMVYITDASAGITPYNFSYTSTGNATAIPADILYTNSFYSFYFGGVQTNYVTGTNSLKIRGLYQRFDISGTALVKEIRYYFGKRTITGIADNITFAIRSTDQNNAPGTVLYTSSSTTQAFNLPVSQVPQPTTITVSPEVSVSNSFYIGIEWDPSKDDVFSLLSNDASATPGEGGGKRRAWWQKNDYTFVFIGDSFSNGFDADIAIGVKFNIATDVVEDQNEIPASYSLAQNYPNPFNPSTVISYQLPVSGHVSLKVFDLLGREVATLVDEFQQAGNHNSQFSILHSELSSGIYFYTIRAGNFIETKKMVLLR